MTGPPGGRPPISISDPPEDSLGGEASTSAIIEAAASLVVVLDLEGRVLRFNRACEETTGWPRSEVVGRHFWELFIPEEELPGVRDAFASLCAGDFPSVYENHWRSRDGELRLISWSSTALTSPDGRPRLIVGTGVDITEARRSELALRQSEARFRTLVMNASDIVTLIDGEGILRYASPAAERLLGWDVESRLGTSALDLVHPEDLPLVAESLANTVQQPGVNLPLQFRVAHADGSWLPVEAVSNNSLHDPAVAGIVVTIRDVRERERIENLLKGNAEVLEMVARRAPLDDTLDTLARLIERYVGGTRCAVVLTDDDGCTLRTAAAPSLGLDIRRAIEGVALDTGAACSPAADVVTDPGWDAFRELVRDHGLAPAWSVPVTASAQDASLGAVIILAEPDIRVSADERRLLELSGRMAAIAVKEAEAEADLAYRATHDLLTGLANRSMFLDHLGAALSRLARRDSVAALFFLDLDGFKPVNDRFGHSVGDELLRVVAERLRAVLRPSDTVARFGGDEFAVLCEDVASEAAARVLAERVGEVIARPICLEGTSVVVTASIGIALASGPGIDADALLRGADQAMYRAKEECAGGYALR